MTEKGKKRDLIYLIFTGLGLCNSLWILRFSAGRMTRYKHVDMHPCLSCPAHCGCFTERSDVEGPHTRISERCNRWCILPFLFSARAHMNTLGHAQARTDTHKNTQKTHFNVKILSIFYLFLGWHGSLSGPLLSLHGSRDQIKLTFTWLK